jgi:glycosyltransferase involved in cell wall biosynthesis
MDDVTCGIKTLLRPACLDRLLTSIFKKYPDMKVVVVDDGKEDLSIVFADQWPTVQYIKVSYDTGLGACRNIMVDAIDTKYTVYLDDDFVFIKDTKLETFREILESGKVDLIGGQYKEHGSFRLYHGLLEQKGDTLHYHRQSWREARVGSAQFSVVDIVNNFFMAKTDQLQSTRWDSELKINTHTEFFLRACAQMRIGYCPEVHVHHAQKRNKAYNKLRARRFREIGLKKHGIEHVRFHGKWG